MLRGGHGFGGHDHSYFVPPKRNLTNFPFHFLSDHQLNGLFWVLLLFINGPEDVCVVLLTVHCIFRLRFVIVPDCGHGLYGVPQIIIFVDSSFIIFFWVKSCIRCILSATIRTPTTNAASDTTIIQLIQCSYHFFCM